VREAVILCGGQGTRLQSVLQGRPKILARVGNLTFLDYLLALLVSNYKIERIVLALGYGYEQVLAYLSQVKFSGEIVTSIETTPLGTGGALKKALEKVLGERVLLLNGDTYLAPEQDFDKILLTARQKVPLQIFSVYQEDSHRFGFLRLREKSEVMYCCGMKEKKTGTAGWINAGYYLADKKLLLARWQGLPDAFSLEEWLQKEIAADMIKVPVIRIKGYFIDIGIPVDYQKFLSYAPQIKYCSGTDAFASQNASVSGRCAELSIKPGCTS
jgi:D-glycero-alpha-D-manno-heptose 1-phosphate guanylyltransferase